MTIGLELICSVLFHGDQFKAGIGTTLKKKIRTLSKSLTEANWVASSFSAESILGSVTFEL